MQGGQKASIKLGIVYFFYFAFLFLYYYLLCLVLPDHNFFQLILPYPSERFCFAYPSGDSGIGWAGHLKTLRSHPGTLVFVAFSSPTTYIVRGSSRKI